MVNDDFELDIFYQGVIIIGKRQEMATRIPHTRKLGITSRDGDKVWQINSIEKMKNFNTFRRISERPRVDDYRGFLQ